MVLVCCDDMPCGVHVLPVPVPSIKKIINFGFLVFLFLLRVLQKWKISLLSPSKHVYTKPTFLAQLRFLQQHVTSFLVKIFFSRS